MAPRSSIIIREGNMEEIVHISLLLPEFENPYGIAEYQKRFAQVPYLILVAEDQGEAVAFKAGYEREPDGSFYSWVGGVLPLYRRQGLARLLAEQQEKWAMDHGYHQITFKTRNRHQAMLHFALSRGFYLTAVEQFPDPMEHRIWLTKDLVPKSPPQS